MLRDPYQSPMMGDVFQKSVSGRRIERTILQAKPDKFIVKDRRLIDSRTNYKTVPKGQLLNWLQSSTFLKGDL